MSSVVTTARPREHVRAVPREVRPRSGRRSVGVQSSIAISLLGILLLGFTGYLYGLTQLSEHRVQENLLKTFTHTLATAVAPVGPAPEGTPVAVLDIPSIGLHSGVVVEGTNSRDLTDGPGHRMGSVLPGQPGVSVIYGRRVTFGAPFAHLMRLNRGDLITTTTGQGISTYKVSSFGDGHHPAPANSTNRLVLVTADTRGVPHDFVTVSADLTSAAQPSPGTSAAAPADHQPLARGLDSSLLPALLWSQALLAVVFIAVFAFARWKPGPAYLCLGPVALAVLWNLYENLACLLPNVY